MSQRIAGCRPFRRKAGSPRVRRVTFAPFARRIYVRSVRSAFGLQVIVPPHPPRGRLLCGSCSSGQSFAFQLPSRVSSRSYGCCSARGSRHSRSPEDFHLQVTSRSAFASRFIRPPYGGPRHAWRTREEALEASPSRAFSCPAQSVSHRPLSPELTERRWAEGQGPTPGVRRSRGPGAWASGRPPPAGPTTHRAPG